MHRLARRITPFAVTLIVSLTLCVPAAYVFGPRLHRWWTLLQLTDGGHADRERALNYVIRLAGSDERVARGAIARLRGADDAHFQEIVAALTTAGVWDRGRVPDETWLRWLGLVAADADPEAQIFVAQRLAELPALARDDRLTRQLRPLLDAATPEVRYNALVTAASLAASYRGHGVDPNPCVALIAERTRDAEPQVARHAWIVLGLLRAAPPEAADWNAVSPPVAEAMLWSITVSDPANPHRAIAAYHEENATPALRAAAVYALAFSDTDAARAALLEAGSPLVEDVTADNQLVIWRALQALPKPDLSRRPPGPVEETVGRWAGDDDANPLGEPISLAAVYRLGIAGTRRPTADYFLHDTLTKLATVEGQTPGEMFWPLTGDKPPLLRVQTLAVAKLPSSFDLDDPVEPINAIMPAFDSDDPTLRELAAVVAASRFDEDRNRRLIRTLLTDLGPGRRAAGGLLAGLSNLRIEHDVLGEPVDLLAFVADAETDWATKQTLRLGLWMQGRLPEMDAQAPALLMRDDVPHTTVLLAMLHRGRRDEALRWLLNPRGEPPVDLVQLFDQRRWWFVLRRYLPADAPPFWVWADPGLERFQIDVLRDWSLLRPQPHHP